MTHTGAAIAALTTGDVPLRADAIIETIVFHATTELDDPSDELMADD